MSTNGSSDLNEVVVFGRGIVEPQRREWRKERSCRMRFAACLPRPGRSKNPSCKTCSPAKSTYRLALYFPKMHRRIIMQPIRQILENAPDTIPVPEELRHCRVEYILWPLDEDADKAKMYRIIRLRTPLCGPDRDSLQGRAQCTPLNSSIPTSGCTYTWTPRTIPAPKGPGYSSTAWVDQ